MDLRTEKKALNPFFEQQPVSTVQIPYWQMRLISKSMNAGAFVTPSLFVPACVWSQIGVKFGGLSIKTSAFQAVVSIIRVISINYEKQGGIKEKINNENLLILFSVDLRNAYDEMLMLQNQLSKPFPFIKEIIEVATSKSTIAKEQVR
jgi:hypothetical protein